MAEGGHRRPYTKIVTPILWIGVIVSFSLTPDPTGGLTGPIAQALSPVAHAAEFFVLGLLLRWIGAKRPLWLLTMAGVLAAFVDEGVQSAVPGRTPDVNDVLADVLGFLLGLWVARHAKRTMPVVRVGVFIAFVISAVRLAFIYVL